MQYIDDLMRNYPLETDSISIDSYQYSSSNKNNYNKKKYQHGGDNSNLSNIKDYPNGGSIPLILCIKNKQNSDSIIEEENKTKREYKTHKTSFSIKNILEKRRDVQPFIKPK